MKRVELLAPAGDYECFKAAINAGADAVYLAGSKFGARAFARNFTDEEIVEAIRYAHLLNRKIYLTVNTLLKNTEIRTLHDYMYPFVEAGLDGVIVQDIGVIACLRREFPLLHVHASTQMAITDLEGIDFLDRFGIKRAVLARELTLDEIINIHKHNNMELECFIHGALCYCYSGKCLMSSFIGGRSGNRGRCAQPCRLPYNGEYILSAKDICGIEIIPQLIEAGIASFKVEGRMKSPDYVAGVSGIYRKYIDLYYDTRRKIAADDAFLDKEKLNEAVILYKEKINSKDVNELITLYTRSGNSKGYYFERNGRDMITISKPGYSKAEDSLKNAVFEKYGIVEPKIDICINVSLHKRERSSITASSTSGNSVTIQAGEILEAKNQPLTKETVIKQMSKLGGTVFSLSNISVDIDDDIFLSVGKLNELRREALSRLEGCILKEYMLNNFSVESLLKDSISPKSIDEITNINNIEITNRNSRIEKNKPEIHVMVTTFEQFSEVIRNKNADIISFNDGIVMNNDMSLESLCMAARLAGKKVYFQLPYIIRDSYFEKESHLFDQIIKYRSFDGALVSNYESLEYLLKNGFSGEIILDYYIYSLNDEAIETLNSYPNVRLTVPLELNRKEILHRKNSNEELIIYGKIPLMISAQCIRKTTNKCTGEPSFFAIKDRTETNFTVRNFCKNCYNVIYNSVPVSLHDENDFISKIKPASLRIQITDEKKEEIAGIIDMFAERILNSNVTEKLPYEKYTKGHLGRGVE